jgi:hypothetical protein
MYSKTLTFLRQPILDLENRPFSFRRKASVRVAGTGRENNKKERHIQHIITAISKLVHKFVLPSQTSILSSMYTEVGRRAHLHERGYVHLFD